MPRKKNISVHLALSMAGAPIAPPRPSSARTGNNQNTNIMDEAQPGKEFSLYKGISNRPLGWKSTRRTKYLDKNFTPKDTPFKRWDGVERRCTDWDGLRRDPELWFKDGNCLVYLHAKGQSKRGPAFCVPLDALVVANCQPLLDRFLVQDFAASPTSNSSSDFVDEYFGRHRSEKFELYIPTPETAEKEQSFLYHVATRNLFAWIFGRPLVGRHLGGALVGLLNSLDEFRTVGSDNVKGIMGYLDAEGYAGMRYQPDHALAILYFAEHFHFKDLWIEAFAHCVGMNEDLITSSGFEPISRRSRALISRSRREMDSKLDRCGKMLGSFLLDDLSDAYLGLAQGARAHLDKFRSFLQSYYIAKLGYYPPAPSDYTTEAFPKKIYSLMCSEFQELYDFLVDSKFTSSDCIPSSAQGGICVLQSVQAFDQRHNFSSLLHPLPLLPEIEDSSWARSGLAKRMSWAHKTDKMKPDPRLVTYASLSKATNRREDPIHDCGLVRAYREFERDCVFAPTKTDKSDKISQTYARKTRWILIYAILQTLLSATKIPDQIRDKRTVLYNLCVSTEECPPWTEELPAETTINSPIDMSTEGSSVLSKASTTENAPITPTEIKPDIDYFALTHRSPQHSRTSSSTTAGSTTSKKGTATKGTVAKARSSLGNMPELKHPRPQRAAYHEILVHGYGNGTNAVTITPDPIPSIINTAKAPPPRQGSPDSGFSTPEDRSPTGSSSPTDTSSVDSNLTSISSSSSRRDSDGSLDSPKATLDSPPDLSFLDFQPLDILRVGAA